MFRRSIVTAAASAVAATLLVTGCGSKKQSGSSLVSDAGDASAGGSGGSAGNGGIVLPEGSIGDGAVLDATDDACGESVITSKPKQTNILILLDESDSMSQTPTGFTQNKWDAMRSALDTALTAVQGKAWFGLDVFPTAADCVVPTTPGLLVDVAQGTTSVPEILSQLQNLSPVGGTPTADALQRAYDYYVTGAGKSLTGGKYVLLATDGGPNCNTTLTPACNAGTCTINLDGTCPLASNGDCCALTNSTKFCLDSTRTLGKVTALANVGVKTVVLGIPGSDPYSALLDGLATAGGVPNLGGTTTYYDVPASGDVTGLTTTIERITANLITTCDFDLVTEPADPNLVNVYVDGQVIKKGTAWTIDTSALPVVVHLIGTTCDWVKQNGVQSVVIKNGCPSVR